MKQTLLTFLIVLATGLVSCRKDRIQLNIKQYDQQQIQGYIAANGLTSMKKDTIGGDTTGIYYQILNPGTQSINGIPVTPVDYPDKISFVYSLRTFDGSYVQADTIANHFYDYLGHIYTNHLPLGLQTSIHNLLKYPDASIRLLIPSHLAYGAGGTGSGSSQVANNRIKGNECLDYYVHAVNNLPVYDDMVIQTYLHANNLTGYTKVQSTLHPGNYYYYKILTPSTNTDLITANSTVYATYIGQLFNATIFAQYSLSGGTAFGVSDLVPGVQEALENYAVAGTIISILIPSTLGYGLNPQSGIPYFSCLNFTFNVISVTP